MWIMHSPKWKFAQWVWVLPAASVWVDLWISQAVWTTAWAVSWAVEHVLNWIPEPVSTYALPALWWAWAWLLSNQIMNDLWVQKKWLKYWVNWLAVVWWLAWWSALAPYLFTWAAWYWAWKLWWKYGKEALKRWVWAAWWLTWWAVVWWAKSAWKWLKWQQKINPQF